MVGKMEQHIFFYYHICYSQRFGQIWMYKSLQSANTTYLQNIWEVHKMSKIMNSSPGNDITFLTQTESANQVF